MKIKDMVLDIKEKKISLGKEEILVKQYLEVKEKSEILHAIQKYCFQDALIDQPQMVGKDVKVEREVRTIKDKVVLKIENLSKRGNFKDISLELHEGEILGLTGIVGAGRSELAEAIFGLNPADSGYIFIDGKEVKIRNAAEAVKHKIAYVPENRQTDGLFLKKSIIDNIAVVTAKEMADKFGILDISKKETVAEKLIGKFKIFPPYASMETRQLSGGNQQRVVLAKWINANPKILIVDEPTNGIDVSAKKEICEIILSMANQGVSILFISSEIEDILNYSDRIIVMRKGMKIGRAHV